MVEKVLRFGLDFWPFWPHWAASPKSLHFPQCVRVLIKTLVVPIFAAKECIRRQEFVLKIYKKFRGSRPPGSDRRAGRGDICLRPPPPNAGAPPLFHNIGFSTVVTPAVPSELGGTTQIWGGAPEFVPPNFKTVSAPMDASNAKLLISHYHCRNTY